MPGKLGYQFRQIGQVAVQPPNIMPRHSCIGIVIVDYTDPAHNQSVVRRPAIGKGSAPGRGVNCSPAGC